MSKKEYDWNLGEPPPRIKPHSIAKQKVYTEYIKKYIHTLNSNPLIPNFNIVIVDAFAGGGEYLTQDNQRHNGSPIKIIETVKATEKTINETRKKQFTIKQQYFFLEKKKANLDYLKNHLKNLEYDKFFDTEIVLQQGEFEKEYKNIIKQIQQKYNENVRAIFILDQYGYTDAPFSVIRDIFRRLPKSEIILTMAVDHLIDYIRDPEQTIDKHPELFDNQKQEEIKVKEGVQFQKTLKDKLDLDLRELSDIKKTERAWRGIIENLLMEKLQLFSNAKFYTPFFLSAENSHRDMWLVHLSNHSQARNVMTQVHWRVANHDKTKMNHYGMLGFHGKYEGADQLFNIEDFSFDQRSKEKMKVKHMEEIPQFLHNKPTAFGDFYNQVANNTPADKEIFKGYMKELLQHKELKIVGKEGEIRRSDIKDSDIIQIPPQMNLFKPR